MDLPGNEYVIVGSFIMLQILLMNDSKKEKTGNFLPESLDISFNPKTQHI